MVIITKYPLRKLSLVFLAAAAALILHLFYKGVLWPNYLFASGYKIKGIDVSNYQKVIDWAAVSKRGGISFTYIKATEGADFKDARFMANWRGASRAGITAGAYHYFVLTSTGAAQAANFISTVPKEAGKLPPAVDIEIDIRDKVQFERQLADFITVVTDYYNQKPILYMTYKDYGLFKDDYKGSTVWIRDIVKPPSARGWAMWQYCDRGRVNGINGYVDLDVYCSDKKLFNNMLSK